MTPSRSYWWPANVLRQRPVSTSQSFTVLSCSRRSFSPVKARANRANQLLVPTPTAPSQYPASPRWGVRYGPSQAPSHAAQGIPRLGPCLACPREAARCGISSLPGDACGGGDRRCTDPGWHGTPGARAPHSGHTDHTPAGRSPPHPPQDCGPVDAADIARPSRDSGRRKQSHQVSFERAQMASRLHFPKPESPVHAPGEQIATVAAHARRAHLPRGAL